MKNTMQTRSYIWGFITGFWGMMLGLAASLATTVFLSRLVTLNPTYLMIACGVITLEITVGGALMFLLERLHNTSPAEQDFKDLAHTGLLAFRSAFFMPLMVTAFVACFFIFKLRLEEAPIGRLLNLLPQLPRYFGPRKNERVA